MKGIKLVGGIAAAACLFAATAATAQEPYDAKLQAAVFNTKLVQAVDECATPATVLNGLGACVFSNNNTEPNATFSVGKLVVKSKGVGSQVIAIVKSSSNAENKKNLDGRTLRVGLTLRVTKATSGATPPEAVTWSDLALNCPGVLVPSNGNFIWKGLLTACGMPGFMNSINEGEHYMREIVSASVEDATSGLPIAVPGVRRR